MVSTDVEWREIAWAFSDESERSAVMLMEVVVLDPGAVAEARRASRSLLLPGQRRVHTTHESSRRPPGRHRRCGRLGVVSSVLDDQDPAPWPASTAVCIPSTTDTPPAPAPNPCCGPWTRCAGRPERTETGSGGSARCSACETAALTRTPLLLVRGARGVHFCRYCSNFAESHNQSAAEQEEAGIDLGEAGSGEPIEGLTVPVGYGYWLLSSKSLAYRPARMAASGVVDSTQLKARPTTLLSA